MNCRLFTLLLLYLFASYPVLAQKVSANFEDTVFYNIDFKKTKAKNISYYRPPVVKEGNRFKVEYYSAKNLPVFKGSVLPVQIDYNYSIEREVAIKDGQCEYYRDDGSKSSEGEYINNHKTGKWTYYYKDGKVRCIEEYYKEQPMLYGTGYYDDGSKSYEGLMVRVAYGKDTTFQEHKQWLYYYRNGKISSIESYYFGVPEGKNEYYDSNGMKRAEGMVKYKVNVSLEQRQVYSRNTSRYYVRRRGQTLKEGIWKYYDSGRVSSLQYYKDGLLDSDYVFYHTPTGKIKLAGRYNRGVKKGIWTIYYDGSESILAKIHFKDNKGGSAKYFDSTNNDRVILEGEIDQNMRVGEWVRYYPGNGKVMSKEYYTKNLLNGTAVGYDSSGALFSEVEYKNGIADGKCTYYYKGTKDKWVVLHFAADTFTGFVNTYYDDGKIKRKTKSPYGDLIQVCYDRSGKIIDCLPLYTQAQFDGDVMTYIGQHLEYPEEARRMRLEGKVKIGFFVDEFGKVQDPYIVEGFDERCNDAALRLVSQMPNWIPSTIEDIPIRSHKTLPIVFWLPPEDMEASGIAEGM